MSRFSLVLPLVAAVVVASSAGCIKDVAESIVKQSQKQSSPSGKVIRGADRFAHIKPEDVVIDDTELLVKLKSEPRFNNVVAVEAVDLGSDRFRVTGNASVWNVLAENEEDRVKKHQFEAIVEKVSNDNAPRGWSFRLVELKVDGKPYGIMVD